MIYQRTHISERREFQTVSVYGKYILISIINHYYLSLSRCLHPIILLDSLVWALLTLHMKRLNTWQGQLTSAFLADCTLVSCTGHVAVSVDLGIIFQCNNNLSKVDQAHHVSRWEDQFEVSMTVVTLASAAHDLLDIAKLQLAALAGLGKTRSKLYQLLKIIYLDVSNMVTLVVVNKSLRPLFKQSVCLSLDQ